MLLQITTCGETWLQRQSGRHLMINDISGAVNLSRKWVGHRSSLLGDLVYERPNISHPRSDICPGTCSARLVNTTNGQVNRFVPALDPGVYTSPKPGTYLRSSLSPLSGPAISPLLPCTQQLPACIHRSAAALWSVALTTQTSVTAWLTRTMARHHQWLLPPRTETRLDIRGRCHHPALLFSLSIIWLLSVCVRAVLFFSLKTPAEDDNCPYFTAWSGIKPTQLTQNGLDCILSPGWAAGWSPAVDMVAG